MKRLLSVLLALGMVLTLLPAALADGEAAVKTDFACSVQGADVVASGSAGSRVSWTLDSEGHLLVTGIGDMESVDIPEGLSSEIDQVRDYLEILAGSKNIKWGPWCEEHRNDIRTVTVDGGITGISTGAFAGCENLTTAEIGSDVKSISYVAFGYCRSLKTIYLPKSLTDLKLLVWGGCDALQNAFYAGSASDWSKIDQESAGSILTRMVEERAPERARELTNQNLTAALRYDSPRVGLKQSALNLQPGDTVTLEFTGSVTSASWVSDNAAVATVTPTGSSATVTAVGEGSATITATMGGQTFTCSVQVASVPVEAISFVSTDILLAAGASTVVSASVSPANAFNRSLSWTSDDPSVLSVVNVSESEGTCTVQGVKEGKTTLRAAAQDGGGAAAALSVTVTAAGSQGLTESNYSMKVDESHQLTLLTPSAAASWSTSDSAVATVSTTGLVTGIKNGTAVISATVDGSSYTCTVTVVDSVIHPTAIRIHQASSILGINYLNLTAGASRNLTIDVTPSDAAVPNVTWSSSDAGVAEIDTVKGLLTANSAGSCTITATAADGSGLRATCTVIVSGGGGTATDVSWSMASASLRVGWSLSLRQYLALLPSGSSGSLRFTTNSTQVIDLDSRTGEIVAKANGTAWVYPVLNNTVLTNRRFTVNVTNTRIVTDINLQTHTLDIETGETRRLNLTVRPNYAEDGIEFITSDPNVCTVDSQGRVTGRGAGTATVTAICDGVSDTCRVNVTQGVINATSIYLSYENLNLRRGQEFALIGIVFPRNADDQRISWGSSNPNVATVSQSGVITAHAAGDAVISARVNVDRGSPLLSYCNVHVTDAADGAAFTYLAQFLRARGRQSGASFIYTPGATLGARRYIEQVYNSADGTITAVYRGYGVGNQLTAASLTLRPGAKTAEFYIADYADRANLNQVRRSGSVNVDMAAFTTSTYLGFKNYNGAESGKTAFTVDARAVLIQLLSSLNTSLASGNYSVRSIGFSSY